MIKKDETAIEFLNTLDQLALGYCKWERRLHDALSRSETSQHTLRVQIRDGVVKKVVHSVEDEIV